MVNHSEVKLGRNRSSGKVLYNIPKLIDYLPRRLDPAPPAVDYTKGVTEWGMKLNGPNNYSNPNLNPHQIAQIRQGLGCCTISGAVALEQVWTLNTGNYRMDLSDDCVLQKYGQWCGYRPGVADSDNGGVEPCVLKRTSEHPGLWNHTIKGFADPSATDLEHCKKAIELFGALYIGVALPVSAQGQTIWDAAPGREGIPGSWGLHCLIVPKYETSTSKAFSFLPGKTLGGEVRFFGISWGEMYELTQAFWTVQSRRFGPYVDEVHAPLGLDWLRWKGMPEGLNVDQLVADQKDIEN